MDMKTFYNWTDNQFVGKWDGKPYVVEPKESILVEEYLANALAKQLTDSIILGECLVTDPKFVTLMEKCFVSPEITSVLNDVDDIAEEITSEEPEKPKEKKKTKKTKKVAKDAENFEGIE